MKKQVIVCRMGKNKPEIRVDSDPIAENNLVLKKCLNETARNSLTDK